MKNSLFYWWILAVAAALLVAGLGTATHHNLLSLCVSLSIILAFGLVAVYSEDPAVDKPAVPATAPYTYSVELYIGTGTQRQLIERFNEMSSDQLARFGLARIQAHVAAANHTARITPTFDLRWWNLTKRRERSVMPAPTVDRSLLPRIEGLHC